MIKRTLFFPNPAYLSTQYEQLVVAFPDKEKAERRIPIEDIGIIILEDPQITFTNSLIMKLAQNKAAIITCDRQHLPCSILQPLVGHSEQSMRYRKQLNCSLPLKKNLWQQTVSAKIRNQARHLEKRGKSGKKLMRWAREVKSGDIENHEGIAAAYYWQNLFEIEGFTRYREGRPPNNLLNYGYAVLRAVAARAIVSSGMLPAIGIFHSNKYNAFCLADDIMEPYRVIVDDLVFDLVESGIDVENLTTDIKSRLLQIPVLDVTMANRLSPLSVAMSGTTSSLYHCFEGSSRLIEYPEFGDTHYGK